MILVLSGRALFMKRLAAARSFMRKASAAVLSAVKSGILAISRAFGVIRSGARPRKFLASRAVISLTVVKQSASRAEAVSSEHFAVILWVLASCCGDICSIEE